MEQQRAHWGSRIGFILAAAGSAVGLGNIWRFPYTTGDNGGGLFVLIYLLCVAFVGVPILMSEVMIGRAAQKQPVVAFRVLEGRRTAWSGIGWLGVAAGFIILSYYVVVAGWAMDYTLKSLVNFTGDASRAAQVESLTYAATTPVDEMRSMLVEREEARQTAEAQRAISRQVRPSSWKAYQEFTAAIEAAGDSDNAKRILLEDEAFAARVREAVEFQPALDQAAEGAVQAAREQYEAMTDQQIRESARDTIRRDRIRERVGEAFSAVATDGWSSAFWTAIFMVLTVIIVAGGISSGIERACMILMPALFILVLVLVVYGLFMPGFAAAVDFVIKPDVHELRPSSILAAMGQAFFSLSLGMGAMITYGSYQRSRENLAGQAVTIAGLDTAVALLACLMIFPIVFSFGQEPSAGPGLVFIAMPLAFAEIGVGGMLLSALFFGLLVFAALTSSISLLEVVASYFIDERSWSRTRAAWLLGGIAFALSLPSAFGADPGFIMSGWNPSYPSGFDFLTTMDFLASNWMLPIGGLFIAIYAGWVMPARLREAELTGVAPALITVWLLLARFVAPAIVLLILMHSIGVLDVDEVLYDVLH